MVKEQMEKEETEEDEEDIEEQATNFILVKQLFFMLCGLAAMVILIFAGIQMIGIQSVSGNSIAEIYYHAMGWGFIGLGILGGGLSINLALKQ